MPTPGPPTSLCGPVPVFRYDWVPCTLVLEPHKDWKERLTCDWSLGGKEVDAWGEMKADLRVNAVGQCKAMVGVAPKRVDFGVIAETGDGPKAFMVVFVPLADL